MAAITMRRGVRVLLQSKYFGVTRNRNIMSSAFNAKEALEELKENPYYAKYSQKIAALQNTLPEEFESRLKDTREITVKSNPASNEERRFSAISDCPKQDSSKLHLPKFTKQKVLNDVMKMELISDKSSDEIKEIWEGYHKHRNFVAAVIPYKTYDRIYSRSQKFPIFLFALPRDKGYEFIMCQFSGHEAHFTPLINYQAHKENAPECVTVVHYTDIQDKGIVLMRGEYNKDFLNGREAQCLVNQLQLYYGEEDPKSTKLLERFTHHPQENVPECMTVVHYTDIQDKGIVLMRGEYNKDVLNGREAQCLVNQLQLYYGEEDPKRTKLLERFTHHPQEFKHMDLIAELECLSL